MKPLSRNWFGLSVAAVVLSALSSVILTYITQKIVVIPERPFVANLIILMISSWSLFLFNIVQNPLIGRGLSNDFKGGLGFVRMNRRASGYVVVAAVAATTATIAFLWASQIADPSVIITLANAHLIYVMAYDLYRKDIRVAKMLGPLLLILAGAILASVTQEMNSLVFSFAALVILLVGRSGSRALSDIAEKLGVGGGTDAVVFSTWRNLVIAVISTLLAVLVVQIQGVHSLFLQTIRETFGLSLVWFALAGFIISPQRIAIVAARKFTSTTRVTMVLSGQVILGVPLTLFIHRLWPGAIDNLPESGAIWGLRFIGAIISLAGVALMMKEK